jgi:hypothetical protein
MSQNLFGFAEGGYKPPVRASDPETSQQAAREIEKSLGRCKQVMVEALQRLGNPSTAAEMAQVAHQIDGSKNLESYRKRAAECARDGLIELGPARACSITGKRAATYKIKGT